jgi:hypothetical protein
LPANLFYGTGIPACILVLDKENAAARKGILMIDASKGFIKDGPKNRLRAPHRRYLLPGRGRAALCPHGAAGRDRQREERLQPQPATLHRQQRTGRPARHRRAPERRYPRTRHRRFRRRLAGNARPAQRPVRDRAPRLRAAAPARGRSAPDHPRSPGIPTFPQQGRNPVRQMAPSRHPAADRHQERL